MAKTAAILLANEWNGRQLTISGVGGMISIDPRDGTVKTRHFAGTEFVVEQQVENGFVAFRVNDSSGTKYLSISMYGDEMRQTIAEALARNIPQLQPEHIPMIADFAVDRQTTESNFEGSGFNYSPMTVQNGPPNVLQVFQLEQVVGRAGFGIKSKFGTYWRSQHWNNTVSQSGHCLRDEHWYLRAAE